MGGGDRTGWIGEVIMGVLADHVAASDARQMERIDAGAHLDGDGLPLGSIPAAFVQRRKEVNLVYPGARELFRRSHRGPGSMVARIVSFDSPPAATFDAGYLAQTTPHAVLEWYQAELGRRGWTGRTGRRIEGLVDRSRHFGRAREFFSVEFPAESRTQASLGRAGIAWPLAGHVHFTVAYRIIVEPVAAGRSRRARA